MLRYALKQQEWSPYSLEPVEFVHLNFDFHPHYIADALQETQFQMKESIPISFFRLGLFKRALSVDTLIQLDSFAQKTRWMISPSIFTKNIAIGDSEDRLELGWENPDELFRCPESGTDLHREGDLLISETGIRWAIRDGIYDFKEAIP
jgi:hypothetical protein